VQCSHLTDDELWLAITKNTNTMSTLFEVGNKERFGFETKATFPILRALNNLELEYQDYATELHRRYSI
jgi:hypothetical protein